MKITFHVVEKFDQVLLQYYGLPNCWLKYNTRKYMKYFRNTAKFKILSSGHLRTMTDLLPSFSHFCNQKCKQKIIWQERVVLLFKKWSKIHSLTYSIEVPVGIQHYFFVKIFLGRIQQSPFIPSEMYIHIFIGHCILKWPYRNIGERKSIKLTIL